MLMEIIQEVWQLQNSSILINNGNIQVNGSGNEGIYVDYGATVRNNGTIHISNITGTGIYVGDGGVVLNEGSINCCS